MLKIEEMFTTRVYMFTVLIFLRNYGFWKKFKDQLKAQLFMMPWLTFWASEAVTSDDIAMMFPISQFVFEPAIMFPIFDSLVKCKPCKKNGKWIAR